MKKRDVAALIDHTILKPEATKADVARIVEEGAAAGTFSVCVSPSMLPLDVPEGLKVACVVGFPSGAVKPQVKAFEAAQAVADGADEIDMVINIELVKDARLHELEKEIAAVRRVVPAPRRASTPRAAPRPTRSPSCAPRSATPWGSRPRAVSVTPRRPWP